MGFITNNERYNQIIDIWTHVNAELDRHVDETIGRRRSGIQLYLHDAWTPGPVDPVSRSVSWEVCVD